MVTDDTGRVAVRHRNDSPKQVVLNNGKEYHFSYRNYVSMCWVNPEDVPAVLNIKTSCNCSGNGKGVFRLCTQQEVNLWTGVGSVHP